MNNFSRRTLLGATALSVSVILTACQEVPAPPAVDPGPEPTPVPRLQPEKVQTVLTEIQAALIAADESFDASLLAPRVSGSALEFRQATYQIISTVPEHAESLNRPSAQSIVPIASTAEGFPRYALALVQAEEEGGLPYFVGLQQNDARSNYTSWGWARQAAGIEMPTVPGVEVGAEIVPEDAVDLVFPPATAIDLYISVLNDGHANGDPDDLVAGDPFQELVHQDIQAERARINEGVERDEVATVRELYTRHPGEYIGLRTADGGAIVMATLRSSRRMEIRSGSINYSEENVITRVLGKMEFETEIVRDYGTTILLYVPSAETGGQIQPIGAYKALLNITGS